MSDNFILDFVERKIAEPVDAGAAQHLGGKSLAKGLLAGLAGGIAATAAKTVAERIYPPRVEGEPEPPAVLAEKIAGHELSTLDREIATETIHWAFGAAVGAAYGALAEFYPAATSRQGADFGITLMALTHEGALPVMGLASDPADQTNREKTSEMTTHIVFGFVTEAVRRFIRRML